MNVIRQRHVRRAGGGGFLIVAGNRASQNVFMLYAGYARSFFSGSSAFLY